MNTVQVVMRIMQEERGYNLSFFKQCGYCDATMRNWIKGRSVPTVTEFEAFISNMNYCQFELLKKVANYENR